MRVLEYGKEHEKTLLFLPCTAEPEGCSPTRLVCSLRITM